MLKQFFTWNYYYSKSLPTNKSFHYILMSVAIKNGYFYKKAFKLNRYKVSTPTNLFQQISVQKKFPSSSNSKFMLKTIEIWDQK